MHPVLLVGHTAVVPVHRVAHVAEAVPLRRALGVPAVEDVVVADRRRPSGHFVLESGPAEERRIGHAHVPVERERRAALDEPSGVDDAVGREEVQAAEHVVLSPQSP